MKKALFVFLVFGLLCVGQARMRAEKWSIINVTVSVNKVITASYLNSSIKIHNGTSTLNVYGRSTSNYWTLAPGEKEDFWPISLYGGSPLTLNTTATNDAIQYIWYENKE